MKSEHHGIDRQCCAQLVEDFVAQALIGQAIDEAGRIGPGGRALDQIKALFRGKPAADRDRRGTERRCFRMLSRWGIERRLEGAAIDADR
jgi:hypothetical protein